MVVEQKSYSWSSFGMHLRKTFQYMLDLSKFNDVTLVCDDQVSISSHKAILSSCSKMFRSIFDFNNCESNVVLHLQGVQSNFLMLIIKYIYVGEILLNNDIVDEFLKTAEYLQIDEDILESFRSRIKSVGEIEYAPIQNLDESKEDHGKIENISGGSMISGGNEDYQECSECDEILENKAVYEIHLRTVHEEPKIKYDKNFHAERRFVCQKCKASFSRKRGLEFHNENIHLNIRYRCGQCSFIAKAKSQLRSHIKIIHEGEKRKCKFCDYSTSYNQGLKAHVNKVHFGKTFNCDKCEYIGTDEIFLKEHKTIYHEGKRKRCTYCDYTTKYASSLRDHINYSHLGKNFYCKDCDYVGKNEKYHNKRYHSDKNLISPEMRKRLQRNRKV